MHDRDVELKPDQSAPSGANGGGLGSAERPPRLPARTAHLGEWAPDLHPNAAPPQARASFRKTGTAQEGRRGAPHSIPANVEALFAGVPDAVVIANASGISHCNQAALEMLGATDLRSLRRRTQLFTARHRLRGVQSGAGIPACDDPLARALRGETCVCDASVLAGKDRKRRVFRCAAAPVREAGRVVGAVLIASDISDRERNVAALRRARDHLGVRARRRAAALASANERLNAEIAERQQVEEELRVMNETLEERIGARTADLLHYQRQLRSLAAELNRTEQRERSRIARELHDNLAQMLALCKIKAGLLHRALGRRKAAPEALALKEYLDEALRFTRTMMSDLSPVLLHQEDLLASLHWLAEKMRANGLEVKIADDGIAKTVSEPVRVVLFESVRELLFNVIKHAGASQAHVTLRKFRNSIRVTVSDRGVGFDPASQRPAPNGAGGFGLFNVRERLDLLGGGMEVKSVRNGGTIIILLAPLLPGPGANRSPQNGAPVALLEPETFAHPVTSP